jgi:hypothetical protein
MHACQRNGHKILDLKPGDKEKNNNYINEPIDDFNHAIDEVRYCLLEEYSAKTGRNKRKLLTGRL